MRVLVTGGRGFIGTSVVAGLLEAGSEVTVLDSRPLQEAAPGARQVCADIRDERAVQGSVRGIDAVCHLAAMVGLGTDFSEITDYASVNDLGTATLLRALYSSGFTGRLVLASSMVVYGEGLYTCAEHGSARPEPRSRARLSAGMWEPRCSLCGRDVVPEPVTEAAPLDPRNVYAATKVHQEHLCAVYGAETGVPVTSLRYHNVYGPGMPRNTPYAGVASLFASALHRGEAPRVFEDGAQLRDFIHVRDVARATVVALTSAHARDGAFNVATGNPVTVGGMAHALASAYGSGAPAPRITGEFRMGDVRHVFASPQRAEEVLGFTAEIELAEGVRDLISTSSPVAR